MVEILEGDDSQKDARNPTGKTPVMVAIEHERYDIVSLLVKRNIDLEKVD